MDEIERLQAEIRVLKEEFKETVFKLREQCLKERQALRSGMIRETLIDAIRMAEGCKSKFKAQDFNDGINRVIDTLHEAFYKEKARFDAETEGGDEKVNGDGKR